MSITDSVQQIARDPAELEVEASLSGYELPSLDFAYGEVQRALDGQLTRADALDTKLGLMIGFSGLIVSVIVGPTSAALTARTDYLFALMSLAGCTAVFFAACLGLAALWPMGFSTLPSVQSLKNKYLIWKVENVKYDLLCNALDVTQRNDVLLRRKVYLLRGSELALFVGLLLLVGALVYVVAIGLP